MRALFTILTLFLIAIIGGLVFIIYFERETLKESFAYCRDNVSKQGFPYRFWYGISRCFLSLSDLGVENLQQGKDQSLALNSNLSSSILLYSENPTPKVKEDFDVYLLLETGITAKNGGKVTLKFNPLYLRVVDAKPDENGIQVLKYQEYDQVNIRLADNTKGIIEVDLSTKDIKDVKSNGFALIKFKAIRKGETKVEIDPSSQINFLSKSSPSTAFENLSLNII